MIEGRQLTFAFHPTLHRGNLLLTDVETGSQWNQLEYRAVRGKLKGTVWPVVPSLQTTWKHWQQLHPDTLVIKLPSNPGRRYRYQRQMPGTSSNQPAGLASIELVLGLVSGESVRAYPFSELAKSQAPVRDKLAEKTVLVHYNAEAPATWATDEQGQLLPAVTVFWWAWREFHPRTETYRKLE